MGLRTGLSRQNHICAEAFGTMLAEGLIVHIRTGIIANIRLSQRQNIFGVKTNIFTPDF